MHIDHFKVVHKYMNLRDRLTTILALISPALFELNKKRMSGTLQGEPKQGNSSRSIACVEKHPHRTCRHTAGFSTTHSYMYLGR